jgi:hypothetical protein
MKLDHLQGWLPGCFGFVPGGQLPAYDRQLNLQIIDALIDLLVGLMKIGDLCLEQGKSPLETFGGSTARREK